MTVSKEQEKTWALVRETFMKADGKVDTFYLQKLFRHGFFFRYRSMNFELACNGVVGTTQLKIETYLLVVRGNAEGRSPDVKERRDSSDLDVVVFPEGIVSLNGVVYAAEEFASFYLEQLGMAEFWGR